MAVKKPDDEVFWIVCTACNLEGPRRNTALMAVESARKAGWEVAAEVRLCGVCSHRAKRLEASLADSG